MGTSLGPTYIPYTNMDPLGDVFFDAGLCAAADSHMMLWGGGSVAGS